MSDVRTNFLFAIQLKVGKLQMLGHTPLGDRRVAPVEGGSFEGPRLKGTVEQNGSDWILVRPDGSLQLDVRLVLRTDDGALIGMRYHGFRHGPPAAMERLGRGERVDPAEYYFRIAPVFETSAPNYAWLNTIVAVGLGDRTPSGPIYQVFEVL